VSSWSPLSGVVESTSGLVESTSGLAESIHGLTGSLNFPFWSVVDAPALARMREGGLRFCKNLLLRSGQATAAPAGETPALRRVKFSAKVFF